LSKKNNINMDHYKTRGRGRQGEGVVHDDYKHSLTRVTALSGKDIEKPFRAAGRSIGPGQRLVKFSRYKH